MEKLAELEQELAETKATIAYSAPSAIRVRLRDARRFVEGRRNQLQSMSTGEPRIARAEIAKHVQKITLTPEGRIYIASGTWDSWDLLGSVAVTMVAGTGSHHACIPLWSIASRLNEVLKIMI